MDSDFPWILAGALLLWLFNLVGGRRGKKVERPQPPRPPRAPRAQPRPALPDPTQTEGSQLERLLQALEQRLDVEAPETPPVILPRQPRPTRGPLGRPASVSLPGAEELEERESLETDPVIESLEREVHRPERVNPDWLAQAEARDRARMAQVEARDRESYKSRHAGFDKRIREPPVVAPAGRRLTTAQIRQAIIWGEILGRPKSER